MKTNYIITTYAENSIGILYRILNVFARRMINVESLTVVEADEEGTCKITFMIKSTEDVVNNIIRQIDKQIGVSNTLYHSNSLQECEKISLYRMFTKTLNMHGEQVELARNGTENL